MTSLPKNPKPHISTSKEGKVAVQSSKKQNTNILSEMISLIRLGKEVRSDSREAIR